MLLFWIAYAIIGVVIGALLWHEVWETIKEETKDRILLVAGALMADVSVAIVWPVTAIGVLIVYIIYRIRGEA